MKITDKQMKTLRLQREKFHGEWNYTIRPATSGRRASKRK